MKKNLIAIIAIVLSISVVSGCKKADTDNYKTGLGIITSVSKSTPASAEANGNAQVDTVIAAVTVDGNGKITNCEIDNAQTKIPFSLSGEIVNLDLSAQVKTKKELGASYGMVKASTIGKEWNEQIDAFAKWTVGKTVTEVKALKVKKVDDTHTAVPDIPELTSTVTITVGDYISAVEKAVNNAK